VKAKEIESHLIENKLVNRSFSVDAAMLSRHMKDDLFDREKGKDGAYRYSVNYEKIMEYFKKEKVQ
jgi:hypothetical protein